MELAPELWQAFGTVSMIIGVVTGVITFAALIAQIIDGLLG